MTDDLEVLVKGLLDAQEAKRLLTETIEDLMDRIGDEMGEYQTTIEGVGTLKRHTKKSRTQWDKDALVRTVLDTRMVDTTTGEVKDESPLDKVLMVWNLGVPRTTALKERGIDADEYCHVETRPGWTLEVIK